MKRTDTHGWDDPQAFVDAAPGPGGPQLFERIGHGELPTVPAGVTTGVVPGAVGG